MHGNRRGDGVALPTLAFAQMGASECLSPPRLLWTTSMSATPLDGLNAVHRHDAVAREVPTRRSSNTVAIAIAEGAADAGAGDVPSLWKGGTREAAGVTVSGPWSASR
jgi:hypothetical protein